MKISIQAVLGAGFSLLMTPALAQDCSLPVQAKVGDKISATALLVTKDPNENGEGEPLTVKSSGGFQTTITQYNTPVPFSFTVTVPNEFLTGDIQGADGDESCSLAAQPANQSATDGDKAEAGRLRDLFNGATVALGAMSSLCAGAASGAGICTVAVSALTTAAGAAALYEAKIAADPPDNSYYQLAQPVFPRAPYPNDPAAPPSVKQPMRLLFQLQEKEIGYLGAWYTTANRTATAQADGATNAVTLQVSYAVQLKRQLAALYAIEIRLRKQIGAAIVGSGVDYLLTPAQVFAFEQQVAATGYPDIPGLVALGVTDPADQKAIADVLLVQDVNETSGLISASFSKAAILNELANAVTAYGGDCASIDFVRSAIGTKSGDIGYLTNADLNGDGRVDGGDLSLAIRQTPHGEACRFSDDVFGDRD